MVYRDLIVVRLWTIRIPTENSVLLYLKANPCSWLPRYSADGIVNIELDQAIAVLNGICIALCNLKPDGQTITKPLFSSSDTLDKPGKSGNISHRYGALFEKNLSEL